MIWHSSNIEDVKRTLGVNAQNGLSSAEIAERIAVYGENTRDKNQDKNIAKKVFKHLTPPLDLLLLIVSAVVLVTNIIAETGKWYVPLIVLILLVLNAVLDVLIGVKASELFKKLKGDIAPSAKVLRDGKITEVPASHLVPGDIVMLEQGDYIPADGRILESSSLTCDESAICNDSAPNEKLADALPDDIADITERKNMVYTGCSVLFGRATVIVTDTGMNTELARRETIEQIDNGSDLPVKRRLIEIGHIARICVLITCSVIFLVGVFGSLSSENFALTVLELLLTVIALAVAAIPEEAAQAVDIILGLGAGRMLKRKAIIQNPTAIEDLGKVSLIISDKTGTLTKNRMKMTMLYDGARLIDLNLEAPTENAVTLIRTAALCGNSTVEVGTGGKLRPVGDPTEVSIVSASMEYCGLTKEELENIYPRMAEVPFDSARKLMTTINMINNRPFAIVKGSPDILINHCTAGNVEGAIKAADEMAKRGLRAIAVAMKPLSEVPSNPNSENMESDLTIMGVFGMTDTISRETTAALRESEGAGIRTVMITGDHITAAEAIAKDLGILKGGQRAITGEELSKMDDDTLLEELPNISVYSRITHNDKMRLINAYKQLGETVAITGDSVEDAAILKAADVGCAMGVTGTDIAKGAADVVLTEDSYISVVGAIKESRGIYANVKRVSAQVISCAVGELFLMLLEIIIFGYPALTALPILWLNLVVGFSAIIGLAFEKAGDDVMQKPPISKKQRFFTKDYLISILWQGGLLSVLGIISYAIGGSAMLFAVLVLSEISLAFANRSDLSIFKIGFHTNKGLLVAFVVAVFTLLIISGPLHTIFMLKENLTTAMVFELILFSIIPLAATEAVKFFKGFLLKRGK
ncbi:MAG: cation-transporting P-type ATPase [Clostridia bacterium]|nr:cation-transporting P-type ATPase [Clostridia bacterium]MBQ4131063.1 cation-transporting P-type ATPase [Clostridia bacterium]